MFHYGLMLLFISSHHWNHMVYIWLLSHNIMSMRVIHILLSSNLLCNILLYNCVIVYFIHSIVTGPLDCFQFLTIMNKVSMNIILVNINMYSFLLGIHKIWIAGTYGKHMRHLVDTSKLFSKVTVPIYTPISSVTSPVAHQSF